MIYSTLKILISFILMFCIGFVSAAEPKVPTEAPYIVLNANLDEPNGYGFCIDTYGAGQSELMQTHTCKPKTDKGTPRNDPGHDVRFEYNADTKQISSYAFEGQCMQVLIATGKSEFALLDCSDHPHQKFVYNASDKTIRLDKDQSYCVIVDSDTLEAGPWVKRALRLTECDKTDTTLKQWLIVSI
ncbi:hypothetical protein ABFY09_14890 [Marinomonas sp. 5E14-1]|uniref:hypothetical protein n=1 Tax=Marinomonas sp. 5E14-1 TaxID=3153922 RepID=UPI0032630ED7